MQKKKIIFKQKVVKHDPLKEKAKTDLVNKCLIELRRTYLAKVSADRRLQVKLEHFKKVFKNLKGDDKFNFVSYQLYLDNRFKDS